MDDEIKKKLAEFHDYNAEARKHFGAHELAFGEPLQIHTEKDLMLYAKWRTKADIALNEFHTLLAHNNPGKLPYTLAQLQKEKAEFEAKLGRTEDWLEKHSN